MKHIQSKLLVLLALSMSLLSAKYIHQNDLITANTPTVNFEEFEKNIEMLGAEVSEKTSWNIYLVLKKEIGSVEMIDYQKSLVKDLKEPFIILAITHKEKKYGIYGSKGYRDEFDIDEVKESFIEPVLGSKVKNDPRAKYLAAMYNGYAEIAEQIAKKHHVTLEHAIGNTNRNFISSLSFLIYLFIFASLAIFFYRKYMKKVSK